jgi:LytR cell envelope-related transcriptional attenuator
MVDLLERIGPFLGIAAFLGLAILAFLTFQQAREIRRLRDWAGRAPERAGDAAEASAAAAEARGESDAVEETEAAEEEAPAEPGRAGGWRDRVRARTAAIYAGIDRRMPVDLRYLMAVLAAAVIAAAVLTSGFGLVGGDSDGTGGRGAGKGSAKDKSEKVEVAVLNATQTEADDGTLIQGVQGLARKIAEEVVKPAGFKAGKETDAPSGFEETMIMFEPGAEDAADELAAAVEDQLGETPVTPMIGEIREVAGEAQVALVIGLDDSEF